MPRLAAVLPYEIQAFWSIVLRVVFSTAGSNDLQKPLATEPGCG
jgi:hypothetical protein